MSRTLHPTYSASRTARLSSPKSQHCAAIARWFGLPARPHRPTINHPDLPLPVPGQILLITGPSGSGKSTLLRHYRSLLTGRAIDLDRIRLPRRPIIDLFPHLPLNDALHLLSRVGLAEAHSYLLPPHRLSAGQRWRLRLALSLARAYCETNPTPDRTNPFCLLADEFAALLDRLTAAIIAHLLRREVTRSPSLCAVLATSHDDLTAILRPDIEVRCDFGQIDIHSSLVPGH